MILVDCWFCEGEIREDEEAVMFNGRRYHRRCLERVLRPQAASEDASSRVRRAKR